METIVENLKIEAEVKNDDYKSLLRDAGMKAMTTECPVITQDAIEEYLKYLILKIYPTYKYEYIKYGIILIKREYKTQLGECYRTRKDDTFSGFYYNFYNGTQLRMCWEETPIENFVGKPPIHVLKSIKEKKHLFDKIVIVTIDEKEVVDPLVCGLKKKDPNRYLIDYWDKDIDISEINIK